MTPHATTSPFYTLDLYYNSAVYLTNAALAYLYTCTVK